MHKINYIHNSKCLRKPQGYSMGIRATNKKMQIYSSTVPVCINMSILLKLEDYFQITSKDWMSGIIMIWLVEGIILTCSNCQKTCVSVVCTLRICGKTPAFWTSSSLISARGWKKWYPVGTSTSTITELEAFPSSNATQLYWGESFEGCEISILYTVLYSTIQQKHNGYQSVQYSNNKQA